MWLLTQPQGHGPEERLKAGRGIGEIGFQQTLEFEQGLVVEAHVIQLVGGQARLSQAIVDGVAGKAGIMGSAQYVVIVQYPIEEEKGVVLNR